MPIATDRRRRGHAHGLRAARQRRPPRRPRSTCSDRTLRVGGRLVLSTSPSTSTRPARPWSIRAQLVAADGAGHAASARDRRAVRRDHAPRPSRAIRTAIALTMTVGETVVVAPAIVCANDPRAATSSTRSSSCSKFGASTAFRTARFRIRVATRTAASAPSGRAPGVLTARPPLRCARLAELRDGHAAAREARRAGPARRPRGRARRERRALIQAVEERKAARNAASQEVARRKKRGESADELIEQSRALGERSRASSASSPTPKAQLEPILLELPNITLPDVPAGGEEERRRAARWGEPREDAGLRAALGDRRPRSGSRPRARREDQRLRLRRLSRRRRAPRRAR